MKQLKKDGTPTKQFTNYMQEKLRQWYVSKNVCLSDCYKNPSREKKNAFQEIRSRALGTPIILSYNKSNFVVGYIDINQNRELCFTVETYLNIYTIPLHYVDPT